jgi:hypothetical protein
MRTTDTGHETTLGIAVALLIGIPTLFVAQPSEKHTPTQAREEIAYTVGVQAYLWGIPLQYYGTVIPEGLKVGGADLNAFRKFTALKTAKDRFVVTPNNVTIDAYANFDVIAEPVVDFVPKLSERRSRATHRRSCGSWTNSATGSPVCCLPRPTPTTPSSLRSGRSG